MLAAREIRFSLDLKSVFLLRKFLGIFFLILFGLPVPSHGTKDAENNSHLQAEISKIIKASGLHQNNLGILITEGENTTPYFSLNSNKLFIPASITKLMTSAAVFSEFEPGFKFKTSLWSKANQQDSTLQGDLFLVGGGDPTFVSETMWYLVNAFVRTGIKEIKGNIVIDDSIFDTIRFDDSRESVRVDRAYDSPVGGMSFNWNSVNVFIAPNVQEGKPARVYLDPENSYVKLQGQVMTSKAGSGNKVVVSRIEDKNFDGDIIHVAGTLAKDEKEIVLFKSITNPDIWAGSNLKSFLEQRGISVTGKIKAGKKTDGALLLAEAEGQGIEEIIKGMNKFSNNYTAEMLTKNLAAKQNPPGTLARGMLKINQFLEKIGIPKKDFSLVNPSGFSRENKFTPKAMWSVLDYMKKNFQTYPEILSSLPLAGVDGTLKRRMKNSPGERWVRGKTGYLSGVVTMAGYAGRPDGTVLIYVFMYNGGASMEEVQHMYDKLAAQIVKPN